ncbi:hypothetical protein CHISP_1954 [Chitinispirillum alkaliphilum]|nr:hypothetical protein CHISP_1954 [Chitinispirillum alkaliphilum]
MKRFITILIAGAVSFVMAQDAMDVENARELMEEKLFVAMEQAAPHIERAQTEVEEYFQLLTEQQQSALLESKRVAAEAELAKAIEVLTGHNVEIAAQTEVVRERFNTKVEELREIQQRIREINSTDDLDLPEIPSVD